jgi:hypothetical protein
MRAALTFLRFAFASVPPLYFWNGNALFASLIADKDVRAPSEEGRWFQLGSGYTNEGGHGMSPTNAFGDLL